MNEDDTFRRLRRSDFNVVLAEMVRCFPDRESESWNNVLKKHNWTMQEYDNAVNQMYLNMIPDIKQSLAKHD